MSFRRGDTVVSRYGVGTVRGIEPVVIDGKPIDLLVVEHRELLLRLPPKTDRLRRLASRQTVQEAFTILQTRKRARRLRGAWQAHYWAALNSGALLKVAELARDLHCTILAEGTDLAKVYLLALDRLIAEFALVLGVSPAAATQQVELALGKPVRPRRVSPGLAEQRL